MSTETDTHSRLGVSIKQVATKVATLARYVGPIALLGTFLMAYSLAIVVANEALAPTAFFTEIGGVAQIAIQTALGVPVVVSMVLTARYGVMLAGESVGDSWEEATLLAAGATWLLMPPLLAVWPSLGWF